MHCIILSFRYKFGDKPPDATFPPESMNTTSTTKQLVINIIAEMQAELDAFFRAKKAKKVRLTSEDLVYLEVMLAQAVGAPSGDKDRSVEGNLNGFALRFLQDFFTLKTKPQVQLNEKSFKMIKLMVDRTVQHAMEQALALKTPQSQVLESCGSEDETSAKAESADDEEDAVVPETPETKLVKRQPYRKNPFKTYPRLHSRLFGSSKVPNPLTNTQWLRSAALSSPSSSSELEESIKKPLSSPPRLRCRTPSKLPVKKRKFPEPHENAVVPENKSKRSKRN